MNQPSVTGWSVSQLQEAVFSPQKVQVHVHDSPGSGRAEQVLLSLQVTEQPPDEARASGTKAVDTARPAASAAAPSVVLSIRRRFMVSKRLEVE